MRKQNSKQVSKRDSIKKLRPAQATPNTIAVGSVERERGRISAILHDSLQPLLVSAKLHLASLGENCKKDDYEKTLRRVDEILTESIQVTRFITTGLTHEPTSIADGLNGIVKWCSDSFGVNVIPDIEPSLRDAIPSEVIKSVRELVFNSVKHSQAKVVRLSAQMHGGRLKIAVSDQGVGFDLKSLENHTTGLGLCRMRQHLTRLGARLDIRTAAGKGSCFTITCP